MRPACIFRAKRIAEKSDMPLSSDVRVGSSSGDAVVSVRLIEFHHVYYSKMAVLLLS